MPTSYDTSFSIQIKFDFNLISLAIFDNKWWIPLIARENKLKDSIFFGIIVVECTLLVFLISYRLDQSCIYDEILHDLAIVLWGKLIFFGGISSSHGICYSKSFYFLTVGLLISQKRKKKSIFLFPIIKFLNKVFGKNNT